MNPDPLQVSVSYLIHRAWQRARTALTVHPERGSLTVELAFIAAFLVAAALVAGVLLRAKLRAEMSRLP